MKAIIFLLASLASVATAASGNPTEIKLPAESIKRVSASELVLVVPIVNANDSSTINNDKYYVTYSVCNTSDSSTVAKSNIIMPEGYAVRFVPTESTYLLKIETHALEQTPDGHDYYNGDSKNSTFWATLNCNDCKKNGIYLYAPTIPVQLPPVTTKD